MGKTSKTPTPTPSSKRSHPEESPGTISPPGNSLMDILVTIEQTLSSFDTQLNLMENLHKELKAMRESLEFSQQQVVSIAAENTDLRGNEPALQRQQTPKRNGVRPSRTQHEK